VAHCVSCHIRFGENPEEFHNHYIQINGEEALEELTERWRTIKKWAKPSKKTGYKGEKEDMYQHYKKELKRVEELREQGIQGRITLINWSV
jgi:hypothetical protein